MDRFVGIFLHAGGVSCRRGEIVKKMIVRRAVMVYNQKEIFARWILGEWKDTHVTSYGVYVNDCPLSRAKAYFIDHSRRGGSCECHECAAFRRLSGQFDEKLLCYGCLDNIDFSNVEKILHLEKEENHS